MAFDYNTVLGVFEDGDRAERAVAELRRAGFDADQIGVLARDRRAVPAPQPVIHGDVAPEDGAAVGAVTGGALGTVLGAGVALMIPGLGQAVALGLLAGALGGAAVGIAGGGLVGALVGLGLSEGEANYYEQELHAGRTIVTVHRAAGRADDARSILADHGAYNHDSLVPGVR